MYFVLCFCSRNGGNVGLGANLSDVSIERARFDDSDLRDADLTDAEFINVDFKGTDFDDAELDGVEFDDCDFKGALNMLDAKNIHDVDWNDVTCPDGTRNNDDCYEGRHLTPAD